jgi:hypothetical protein
MAYFSAVAEAVLAGRPLLNLACDTAADDQVVKVLGIHDAPFQREMSNHCRVKSTLT